VCVQGCSESAKPEKGHCCGNAWLWTRVHEISLGWCVAVD
jgi:hypothetical protein